MECACRYFQATYNAPYIESGQQYSDRDEERLDRGIRPVFFPLVPISMSSSRPVAEIRHEPSDSSSTRLAISMMDNDLDLRDFSNQARIFPLPNVVMVPHVVLPLHVFEPRYRQMTEDALAGDRLITMIQISPPPRGQHWDEPVPLEAVGCLGRIIRHERLPDGRYNMLLLGRKRVRLNKEISTGKLYRMVEVEVLEDVAASLPEEPSRGELIELFRQLMQSHHELDPDLDELLRKEVPMGVLSDIIAHALNLPPALKQGLLAETSVDRRVDILRTALQQVAATGGLARPFPPPFSIN